MQLSVGVIFAVLGAALLHAAWNAMIKGSRDVLLDTALITLGAGAVVVPFLPFISVPERASWPYLGASVLIHIGYYVALVGAYRAGDLSYGYPLMRGVAPLIVAASALAWFGEAPSPGMWIGVALISLGVLSIGVLGFRWDSRAGAATGWAFANAAIIAAYTLVDAAGVRAAGGAERYVAWIFVLQGMPFAAIVLWRRGRGFTGYVARNWHRGLVGGAFSVAAYGIALWAMTRAPVAAVAALRETSVIFAALFGAYVLKEGSVRRRIAGAVIVAAGVAALRS